MPIVYARPLPSAEEIEKSCAGMREVQARLEASMRATPPPPEPPPEPTDPLGKVRNEAGRAIAQMQQTIHRVCEDAMLIDPFLRPKLGGILSWHGAELQRLLDKLVATAAEREQPTEPAGEVQS